MNNLESLRPKSVNRVMDLVREAGIDVSDWVNFKGGAKKAKSNPKYCYNWDFITNNIIVLNIWYTQLSENEDKIECKGNLRSAAIDKLTKKIWRTRASQFDFAIKLGFDQRLPIRAIINDGYRRQGSSKNTDASKVKFRFLDTSPWTVTSYDNNSGEFVLTRGIHQINSTDQFTLDPDGQTPGERVSVSGEVFIRSSEVRRIVLERAKGKCEYCGANGFITTNGTLFLETHHIVPLSEGGPDITLNVAALCPNHHREAHHGANASLIKSKLLEHIKLI